MTIKGYDEAAHPRSVDGTWTTKGYDELSDEFALADLDVAQYELWLGTPVGAASQALAECEYQKYLAVHGQEQAEFDEQYYDQDREQNAQQACDYAQTVLEAARDEYERAREAELTFENTGDQENLAEEIDELKSELARLETKQADDEEDFSGEDAAAIANAISEVEDQLAGLQMMEDAAREAWSEYDAYGDPDTYLASVSEAEDELEQAERERRDAVEAEVVHDDFVCGRLAEEVLRADENLVRAEASLRTQLIIALDSQLPVVCPSESDPEYAAAWREARQPLTPGEADFVDAEVLGLRIDKLVELCQSRIR